MKRFIIYGFINNNPVLITNSENLSFAATFDENMILMENMRSSLSFKIADTLENGEANPFMGLVYPGAKIRLKLWQNISNIEEFKTYDYIVNGMSSEFYKDIIIYNVSSEDLASSIFAYQGQGLDLEFTGTLKQLAREVLYQSKLNLGYRNINQNLFNFASYRSKDQESIIKNNAIKFNLGGDVAGCYFTVPRDKRINSRGSNLPSEYLVNELLKVSVNTPTTPIELGLWFKTLASDGYQYGDLTKNGTISSLDVSLLDLIISGTAPEDIVIRWENIILPSLITQSWFTEDFTNYNKFNFNFNIITGAILPTELSTYVVLLRQKDSTNTVIRTDMLNITDGNGLKSIPFICLENTINFEVYISCYDTGISIVTDFGIYLDLNQYQSLVDQSLHLLGDGSNDIGSFSEDDFMGELQYFKGIVPYPKKSTVILSNSNLYNGLVEIAKIFDAEIKFDYEQNTVNFINKDKNYKYRGYRLLPDFNLLNLTREETTNQFSSILNIRSSDISLIPDIPQDYKRYLYDCINNDFNSTYYFKDMTYDSFGNPDGYTIAGGRVAADYISESDPYAEEKYAEIDYFTSVMNKIPSFSSTLYSLDYFKNNNKISQEKYDLFNKYVNDDLRKLNIKSTLFRISQLNNQSEINNLETQIREAAQIMAVSALSDNELSSEYRYVKVTGVSSNILTISESISEDYPIYAVKVDESNNIPPEILTDRIYYAMYVGANQIKLSTTTSGTAITIANNSYSWYLFTIEAGGNTNSGYSILSSRHNQHVTNLLNYNSYTDKLYSLYSITPGANTILLTSGLPSINTYTDLLIKNEGFYSLNKNGIKYRFDEITNLIYETVNTKSNLENDKIYLIDLINQEQLKPIPNIYQIKQYEDQIGVIDIKLNNIKNYIGVYTTNVLTPSISGSYQIQRLFLGYIISSMSSLSIPTKEGLNDLLDNRYHINNLTNLKDKILNNLYKEYKNYIKETFYENTDEITADGLLEQAFSVFNKSKYPEVIYGISIIDITAIEDYDYIDIIIGDKILIQEESSRLYKTYNDTKYLEVSQISYNLRQPEATSLTVAPQDETTRILQKVLLTISDL